ncbi:MAG: SIR2 family protein [Chloroflexi bacterium]|nr:SIR2 family protein [Chloroflexota bacterium]
MTDQLFGQRLDSDEWQDIISHYPGAVDIADRLQYDIRSEPDTAFETLLGRFADHDDPTTRTNFKFAAPYLRDLLYKVSREYTHFPSGYVELATKILADVHHDVLFLVLNYDDLLEQALAWMDETYRVEAIHQYVSEDRQAKILKLHGSITWFKRLGRQGNLSWDEHLRDFDIFEKIDESDFLVRRNHYPANTLVIANQHMYPILTAPLAGKSLDEAVAPDSHVKVAREFLKTCSKFLIIGTSGLDEDLMSLLDASIPPTYRHFVNVVGQGTGAGDTWSNFQRRVKAFQTFHEFPPEVFDQGFQRYLQSNEFQEFAEFVP